ncbi:MAG: c-type cytochrome [Campylobacterales bacterium]|nr:c-type cytochrome [Campylobacterales bacterium]
MSAGKIIGLSIAGVVVVLMFYVMTQGGGSVLPTPSKQEEGSVASAQSSVPKKSAEEQKLEELEEQTKELSYVQTSKLYASKCAACHGREGEGRILGPAGTKLAPPIKGRSEAYILEKLEDYRHNRVENTLMKGLLNNSSDEELHVLAREIANFK